MEQQICNVGSMVNAKICFITSYLIARTVNMITSFTERIALHFSIFKNKGALNSKGDDDDMIYYSTNLLQF